jgi:hypothetical protein
MTFEEVKLAVLSLNDADQKRLITEVVPVIWPKVCGDQACVNRVRGLVDEDTIKEYKKQHMDHI